MGWIGDGGYAICPRPSGFDERHVAASAPKEKGAAANRSPFSLEPSG